MTVGISPVRGHVAGKARSPAQDSAPVVVRFENVSKRFGDTLAVDGLTLDIRQGEFFALLGPSGCGKTTLLRMLAGFEQPDSGRVLLDGHDITAVPPHKRSVNMMFQSYALFPHLDVDGNVGFGLKQEGLPKDEIARRVAEILSLVKLEGFGRRRIEQLSGGQRQRVALARSLVKRPSVLLLDEPLAALDKKLRGETQFELIDLQRKLGTTFVIVTHDQEEAMTVADRMAVMDHGKLVQVATPTDVYEQPVSRWVADFIGEVNLIEGRLAAGARAVEAGDHRFLIAEASGAGAGDSVCIALRPEKVRIAAQHPAGESNVVVGVVWDIGYLGDVSIYKVRLDNGSAMKAVVPNTTRRVEQGIRVDDKVWLWWAPEAGVVLTR